MRGRVRGREEAEDAPRVAPDAEGDVAVGRGDELVLGVLAVALADVREAERLELGRARVVRVVEVHRVRVRAHERARGQERPVAEGRVFQHLAPDRRCGGQSLVSTTAMTGEGQGEGRMEACCQRQNTH